MGVIACNLIGNWHNQTTLYPGAAFAGILAVLATSELRLTSATLFMNK